MRVKICGITDAGQGGAIASLGATALGFICVPQSPRYVPLEQLQTLIAALPKSQLDPLKIDPLKIDPLKIDPLKIDYVGVFANADPALLIDIVQTTGLTVIQLHGQESPAFCQQIKQALPDRELIKAFRIRQAADLETIAAYEAVVDTLLLDAYHPEQLGGTGHTLDWTALQRFQPARPWFLAGGLTPANVLEALRRLAPDGIDLSSGVEQSPGNKDLGKVAQLFEQLRSREQG